MFRSSAAGLALAALLAFGAASAAANKTASGSAPSGNPKGLALLARVHAAYRHVPAVVLTGRSGALHVRFSILLRKGVAQAEEFSGTDPSGVTVLVARGDGPTYAREPGKTCWRRLGRSDPQSLSDIGVRFPDVQSMKVKAPRRVGAIWLLPFVVEGHASTMRISAKTLLVESLTTAASGRTVTEHDHALTKQPKLPTPTPSC